MLQDEDNEFEHFHDPEEFEGYEDNVPRTPEQPKITISKVIIVFIIDFRPVGPLTSTW